MGAVEIIATIVALAILIKLTVILINPKRWMNLALSIMKYKVVTTIVYLILAIVTGYYVLKDLSIVQVAAAMGFMATVMGVTYMAYAEKMSKLIKNFSNDKNLVKESWLIFLIWIAFAVWVLIAVFM